MHTFQEAATLTGQAVGHEAARLATHAARVAPGFVLDATYEEDFYLGNNLPERLRGIFAPLNLQRVDEDLLETLCAQAQDSVRTSYLLDDAVQLFYRALHAAGLGGYAVHVRRDGAWHTETAPEGAPPSEVLLAIKRLWVHDWSFDTTLDRIDSTGTFGIDARPVLVFAGPPGRPDELLAHELGWPRALLNAHGIVGA